MFKYNIYKNKQTNSIYFLTSQEVILWIIVPLGVLGFYKSEISLFCLKKVLRIPVRAFVPWADATATQLVLGCKLVLVPWLIDSIL